MGSVTETVKTVNSTVRTVAFAGLVSIVGAGGYIGYSQYTANERAFKDKEAELEAAQGQLVGLKKDLDVKVQITTENILATDTEPARVLDFGPHRGDLFLVLMTDVDVSPLSPEQETGQDHAF